MPEIMEMQTRERMCTYRILRYTPNLVRDEWVNIGVLVFDPKSGEHRLRLIEEQEEYARIRRLHPDANEAALRGMRDHLEQRLETARSMVIPGGNGGSGVAGIQEVLRKWDETLSNLLQLAPQKGIISGDLDSELERLYGDHAAVPRRTRIGAPGSRAHMRSYCSQVFRQARLWDRIQKSVRASEFTFPGDPMRIDYSYRYNGTRGFLHTLPVTRAPNDAKVLAHTAEQIAKSPMKTEFAAVTDIALNELNDRDRFVKRTLRNAGVEPVPLEHFAVWVGKLKPMIQ